MRSRADRRRAVVLDALLVVAAAAGALVVLWRVVTAAFGLELVTFATGSMAPAYPQGSIAIAQHVPLDRVRVGDVVTVGRGEARLPITHRVVGIRLTGSGAAVRLRGDANADPDPTPYTVTTLDRVVGGVPPMVSVVVGAQGPLLGVAGAAVAALAIGWAIWPQRRRVEAEAEAV